MTPEEIRQMELYYANLASTQASQQMQSMREEQERQRQKVADTLSIGGLVSAQRALNNK